MRLLAALAAFALAYYCASGQADSGLDVYMLGSSETRRDEIAIAKYLWPILKSGNLGARISYQSPCGPSGKSDPLPFPKIKLRSPTTGSSTQITIEDIFLNDANVKISVTPPGLITINLGDLPDKLLQTKIGILSLSALEQYNPALAIFAMERSEDMQRSLKQSGLRLPWAYVSILGTPPKEGSPHLPATITNETVSEILDTITITFKGITQFGWCKKTRLYNIKFMSGGTLEDLLKSRWD